MKSKNVKNIKDKEFGDLKAICLSDFTDKKQRAFWICECSCGRVLIVRGDRLRSGRSTRCSECNERRGRRSRFIEVDPYYEFV